MPTSAEHKIVMVLPPCRSPLYGTAKQALALTAALQSRQIPVTILSQSAGVLETIWKRASAGQQQGGKIELLCLPTLALQPAWSFLGSLLVWGLIHRKEFRIFHAHNAALGVIATLVARVVGKKVLIKIPSMQYVEYLTGGSLFRQLRRRLLLGKANHFIAVSREIAAALQQQGIPSHQVALIPNGVEAAGITDTHNRTALKMALLGRADVQVALYVGRLVEEKGLDRLLTVWASMPQRQSLLLLIVGDGPLRKPLEGRARTLRLFPAIRFVGHQEKVANFYAIADIFVLPSKTEGLSNALLEAMAAGVPAVVSDVGGNRDVIADQKGGLLVNWEDTAGCVKALTTLLCNGELRQRLQHAASERVQAFALAQIAACYEQLYKAIM